MVRLYHGTPRKNRSRIKRDGLTRFTWVSTSKRDASEFGKVKGSRQRDVWEVRIDKRKLKKMAWRLGGKRGEFWKIHKKPPKPKLVGTYGRKKRRKR